MESLTQVIDPSAALVGQTVASFVDEGAIAAALNLAGAQSLAPPTDYAELSAQIDSEPALAEAISTDASSSSQDITGYSETSVNPAAAQFDRKEAVLAEALVIAVDRLQDFQDKQGAATDLQTAFGNSIDFDLANRTIANIADGSAAVEIQLTEFEDSGALGAFAAATDTVYISERFLVHSWQSPETVADVLLEEWGHYLDSVLNESDSIGDEGQIFANLVNDNTFDLAALRMEDDAATLTIAGEAVAVEQAVFNQFTLTPTWIGFVRGNFLLAFRRDGTVTALTDIYVDGNFRDRVPGRVFQNIQSPQNFNLAGGQFQLRTFVSNTTTFIRPDGTIGFRSGFIRPRLTVSAPGWNRAF